MGINEKIRIITNGRYYWKNNHDYDSNQYFTNTRIAFMKGKESCNFVIYRIIFLLISISVESHTYLIYQHVIFINADRKLVNLIHVLLLQLCSTFSSKYQFMQDCLLQIVQKLGSYIMSKLIEI